MTVITDRKCTPYSQKDGSPGLSLIDIPGVFRGIAEVVDDEIIDISENPCTTGFLKRKTGTGRSVVLSEMDDLIRNNRIWIGHCEESRHLDQPVSFEYTQWFDDDERYFSATVRYLCISVCGHPRFAYVISDITDRIRVGRELSLARKKLDLMNIVAWHEIQNKINGVRGYVDLSKEMMPDAKGMAFLEAEECLLIQIHNLLQYTKDYQKIGTQPHRWIRVESAVRVVLSGKSVDMLRIDLDVDDLELFCDPTLEKMFALLIEYTLKNRKDPEIKISSVRAPGGLHLIYEDNSAGIPYSRKQDLFTREIVRAEDFCFTFVHDILECSRMSIKETGEPGRGTRFEIMVPHGAFRFKESQRS